VEHYDTLGKENYAWGQRRVRLTPPGQIAGVIVKLRFDAAWEIHLFLVSRGIPYAIIGGDCFTAVGRTTIYERRRLGGYGLGGSFSQGRG
jgi:hypothetical protein